MLLTKEERAKRAALFAQGRKKCYKCCKIKNVDDFYKRKRSKDGLCSYCKECMAPINKTDKRCIPRKEQAQLFSQGKKKCPNCGNIKDVDCFSKAKSTKDGLHSNCKECTLEQINKRLKSDPYSKLVHYTKTRSLTLLKKYSNSYQGKSKLLGFNDQQEFFDYFTPLLQPGMTFENHGDVWDFDHILPCALFDLNDDEQLKICFHYTNLQPMFKEDNISKSSLYEGIRYFHNKPPVIVDENIAPEELVKAIKNEEKIDYWTWYGYHYHC